MTGRGRAARETRQITSAMIACAWCVINCPDDGESARVLAQLVLDAAEAGPPAPA